MAISHWSFATLLQESVSQQANYLSFLTDHLGYKNVLQGPEAADFIKFATAPVSLEDTMKLSFTKLRTGLR